MNAEEGLRALGRAARGIRVLGLLHQAVAKRSYLVTRRGERMVLRIDEPAARALRLDRRQEARVLHAVARTGVGPELVAMKLRTPAVLLMRYVPGREWTTADLGDPRRLQQLAQLLRSVHSIASPVPALDLATAASRYAADAGGTRDARRLAAQVERLLGDAHPVTRVALCHHDPLAANIVGLRRPQLIDWEYAAAGDPLFDLAAVIRHHGLAPPRAREFLVAYFGSAGAIPHGRLAVWYAVYDRILLLWLSALESLARLSPKERDWMARARRRLR